MKLKIKINQVHYPKQGFTSIKDQVIWKKRKISQNFDLS